MTKTRRHSGFTLIEMMAVIVIILLVYAMAAPAISRFLKGNNMAMATEQTQKMISRARQLAITTAGFYAVQINSTLSLVGIYDASSTDTIDTSDPADKLWKVPRGVALTLQASGTDNRVTTSGGYPVINIIFNANGGVHNGSATESKIKFTDTNAAATTDRDNVVHVYRTTGMTRLVKSASTF